jgi:hypothetical protein
MAFTPTGGGAPASPSLGTISTLTNTGAITPTITFTGGHTSATGNVLVFFHGRRTASSVTSTSITVGGVSATEVTSTTTPTTNGHAIASAWVATGVPTGSAEDVVITVAASGAINNPILFVCDIANWSGTTGGVNSVRTTTAASSITVSATVATGKLIMAMGGGINGGLDPFSATGWTKQAEIDNGTADNTDNAAALFSKTSASTSESAVITSAASDENWAASIVEIT